METKRLIDANALRKEIDLCEIETFNDKFAICEQIVNAPTVDAVEVVHGRWVWSEHGELDYEQYWNCSECGDSTFFKTNYCPNCGAKMDGDRNG